MPFFTRQNAGILLLSIIVLVALLQSSYAKSRRSLSSSSAAATNTSTKLLRPGQENVNADAAAAAAGSRPAYLGVQTGRPAQVIYPANLKQQGGPALPLIMVLHSFGSNASYHDKYLGISAQNEHMEFITMLPDGTMNSKGYRFWNTECCNKENLPVDDFAYLTGLIDEAKKTLNIDEKQIYLIGHSNGGEMALQITCRTSDIRGIVSISGFGLPADCAIPKPCTALIVHGTQDDVVPFELSSQVVEAWVTGEACLSDWRQEYKRNYDCDTTIPAGKEAKYDGYRDENCGLPGYETTVIEYSKCDGGATVSLWKMKNATHVPAFSKVASQEMLATLMGDKHGPCEPSCS